VFDTKLYENNGEIETKRKIICPFLFSQLFGKTLQSIVWHRAFFPFKSVEEEARQIMRIKREVNEEKGKINQITLI
jgi:hypothetical protein